MKAYPNLIKEICETAKTIDNVKKAIPILIRWAQNGITNNHYKDLNRELGYTTFSGIGHVLGCVEIVIKELSATPEFKGTPIPTLNALCTNSSTNLPSYGFEFVLKIYASLSKEEQRRIVSSYNDEALRYQHWDKVLKALCLSPSVAYSKADEEKVKMGTFSKYSEGQFHKEMKAYIKEHPESIGLTNVTVRDEERVLLSGDRLDVYFQQKDNTRIAVEVKSRISPDEDILRGLYQCVKYKAILDAENKVHGDPYNSRVILVLEGFLSDSNYQVKDSLGVEVVENFKI